VRSVGGSTFVKFTIRTLAGTSLVGCIQTVFGVGVWWLLYSDELGQVQAITVNSWNQAVPYSELEFGPNLDECDHIQSRSAVAVVVKWMFHMCN
jgi:hypothetical protein